MLKIVMFKHSVKWTNT